MKNKKTEIMKYDFYLLYGNYPNFKAILKEYEITKKKDLPTTALLSRVIPLYYFPYVEIAIYITKSGKEYYRLRKGLKDVDPEKYRSRPIKSLHN